MATLFFTDINNMSSDHNNKEFFYATLNEFVEKLNTECSTEYRVPELEEPQDLELIEEYVNSIDKRRIKQGARKLFKKCNVQLLNIDFKGHLTDQTQEFILYYINALFVFGSLTLGKKITKSMLASIRPKESDFKDAAQKAKQMIGGDGNVLIDMITKEITDNMADNPNPKDLLASMFGGGGAGGFNFMNLAQSMTEKIDAKIASGELSQEQIEQATKSMMSNLRDSGMPIDDITGSSNPMQAVMSMLPPEMAGSLGGDNPLMGMMGSLMGNMGSDSLGNGLSTVDDSELEEMEKEMKEIAKLEKLMKATTTDARRKKRNRKKTESS